MKSVEAPLGPSDEVSALIAVLHTTGQRLEELTAGQVDGVLDPEGRTFLLQSAQEQLQLVAAARQTAILNALPAHIALLDIEGVIVSVNEAWRQFADANALQDPGHGVGVNYLEVCDRATGVGALEARQVAAGIRAVLSGEAKRFSIEYPCHSLTIKRWFLLVATPLPGAPPQGAVVMHVNVTEQNLTTESLVSNEVLLRQFIRYAPAAIAMLDTDLRYLQVSERYMKDYHLAGQEIIGHCHYEIFPDIPQRWKDMHQRVLAGTVESCEEDPFPRADGTTEWLQWEARPWTKAGGEIGGVIFFTQVITERKQAEQVLQLRQNELRVIIDMLPAMIWFKDTKNNIVRVNQRVADSAGKRVEQIEGKPSAEIYPLEAEKFYADDLEVIQSGVAKLGIVETMHDSEGKTVWMQTDKVPVSAPGGAVSGIVVMARDVSEGKKAQNTIAHLSRVYAVLSGINALIVRVRARSELFGEACRIAVKEGGFVMSWIGIVDPDTGKIVPTAYAGMDENHFAEIGAVFAAAKESPLDNVVIAQAIRDRKIVTLKNLQKDSRILFKKKYIEAGICSIAVLPLMVSKKAVGVLVLYASENDFFHDEELHLLTDLAGDIAFAIDHLDKRERLEYLAYYDVLTGLANRTLFLDRVTSYARAASAGDYRLALCLIDLERFKNLNDSLGRAAGDALLKQVAMWLTTNMGDAALLGRMDADHFALVIPEVRQEGAVARLLEKIMGDLVEHPFILNENVFRISAKAGVALFPDDGGDVDTLFKNAEAALKKAKAGGERYLFYTQKMTETVAARLTLENQLRQAVDKGEFVLHYQPKINLRSGKLTGAEALIRWNDPRTGLVPPGQFIPVLEETGLIYEVGRWALRQAIDDYLRWKKAGLAAVRIAVNVSPLQLRNRGFLAEVEQAVGVDARAAAGLELEITESLIMEDVRNSISMLAAIRKMGIVVAIDDFGTGFSSLSYLSKLPVDTIKIDRSFISDMTAAPEGLALVSTIINLAHELRLNVVAEGVETEEQSRLLHLLKCDEMQGYLFSKPLPGAVFENYLVSTPAPGA